MGRPFKCPYCGVSGKSVAKGFRYNKSGKVRLRKCRACNRRWTAGPSPKGHDVGDASRERPALPLLPISPAAAEPYGAGPEPDGQQG